MELKIIIDDIQIDNDLYNSPKKIKETLEDMNKIFPFIVENISLVSFFKIKIDG